MEFEYTGPISRGFPAALIAALKAVPSNYEIVDHFIHVDGDKITIYTFAAEIL